MNSNLPLPEYRFNIDVTGEETGIVYKGDFAYHRLTIGEKLQLQQWIMDYTKGAELADSIKSLYITLAILRFGCDACPDWFTNADYGLKMYDFNVINEIFEKRAVKESEWAEKLKEKAEKVKITPKNDKE